MNAACVLGYEDLNPEQLQVQRSWNDYIIIYRIAGNFRGCIFSRIRPWSLLQKFSRFLFRARLTWDHAQILVEPYTRIYTHGIQGASCVAIVMESTYCVEAMVRGYHHAMHRCVLRYFGLLFRCELSVASSLRQPLRSGAPNGFVCFSYRGGCVESGPLVSERESAG